MFSPIFIKYYFLKNTKLNKESIADSSRTGNGNIFYSEKAHCLFLFFSTLLLYSQTSSFGFNLDDEIIQLIISRIDSNWDGIKTIFIQEFGKYDYRPITVFVFWLESKIFGAISPGISHVINSVLYAFLSVQIYRYIIFLRFVNDKKMNVIFAFFAVLFFVVHPNHVSVVANIKSRDNILSMLFGILSNIQMLKYLADRKKIRILYFALLFTLALLSKYDAYVFGFLPILYVILYKGEFKKNILSLLLFSALLMVVFTLRNFLIQDVIGIDNVRPVVDSPLANAHSYLDIVSLALTSLFYYIKFSVLPFGHYFYFGYNQIPLAKLWDFKNILAIFTVLAVLGYSIYRYKENKAYLFMMLFYGGAILYALNYFVPVSGIVMDRYNFIASLAFCMFYVLVIIDSYGTGNKLYIGLLVIPVFAIFTIVRTSDWRSKEKLYNADIKHLENSAHANYLLGALYVNNALFDNVTKADADNMVDKGEYYIDKSIAINPNITTSLEGKGVCQLYKGRYTDALYYFGKTLQIDSNYISASHYMALSYRDLAKNDSADYWFRYTFSNMKYGNVRYVKNYLNFLHSVGRSSEIDSTIKIFKQRWPNNKDIETLVLN